MKDNYHITSSCSIHNHTVVKDGGILFDGTGVTEPADFLVAAYRHFALDYARFYKMDNLSKLGWLASEIVMKDVFQPSSYKAEEIGLILSNANASLDTDIKYLETVKEIASPAVFVYTLPNIMIGEISIRNHFKGESCFFIAERFDADFIHQYVSTLMDNDVLQCCICGWVDLLGKHYQANLFLIQKKNSGPVFSVENINTLFTTENRQQ